MICSSVALGGKFSWSFWRLLEIGNNGAHLLDVPSLLGISVTLGEVDRVSLKNFAILSKVGVVQLRVYLSNLGICDHQD